MICSTAKCKHIIIRIVGSYCGFVRACQIGPDILRLHLNGGVVGEKKTDVNGCFGVNFSTIVLSGGDSDNSVQGYAHYVRVLPQPTVTNHYVKVGCIH